MNADRQRIGQLLTELRDEMQRLDLWSEQYPSAEAMASVEPFAVDTMDLEQWLQFIFIARIRAILEADSPLPTHCDVAPYAEQRFQERPDTARLVSLIGDIDELVTRTH